MAIGSLFGNALSGISSRVQEGFSGMKDRFAQPLSTNYDFNKEDEYERYLTDLINWQGRKDLLAQGISGIPEYKPDFRGRAKVGRGQPTQFSSLMAGPQVGPYAPLYLDPRRRQQ